MVTYPRSIVPLKSDTDQNMSTSIPCAYLVGQISTRRRGKGGDRGGGRGKGDVKTHSLSRQDRIGYIQCKTEIYDFRPPITLSSHKSYINTYVPITRRREKKEERSFHPGPGPGPVRHNQPPSPRRRRRRRRLYSFSVSFFRAARHEPEHTCALNAPRTPPRPPHHPSRRPTKDMYIYIYI